MEIPQNMIPKVGIWKVSEPTPKHDFSAFADTEFAKTNGLVAATQKQLEQQLISKMRLEPNAAEIRYFYYEEKKNG